MNETSDISPARVDLEASSASSEPRLCPLAEQHGQLGGRLDSILGVPLPRDYGAPSEEYQTLLKATACLDRSWRVGVEVTGDDRVRFLNGLLTCELQGLEPGQGTYGFVTSIKGRILADVTVLVLEDRLWLDLPRTNVAEIVEHCVKYRIVDRVEFEIRPQMVPLSLLGPEAAQFLGASISTLPDVPRTHREIELEGRTARLVREPLAEIPGFILWLGVEDAGVLLESWNAVDSGPRPIGFDAFDRWRIERGLPLFGADFGVENFPQETGFEEAVSYTKGCYLGQEVVARIHYRGGVNRRLSGLFLGNSSAQVGEPITHDGREAGQLSSMTRSPSHGGQLGLAVLHKRAAEPGTAVELASGGTAEVVALPFGSQS